MYTVADARPYRHPGTDGFVGGVSMSPWRLGLAGVINYTEGDPPHSQGYNMLFNDAHVAWVERKNYLFPPRTASNWNRDHKPHPELWSSPNQWVIQN